MTSDQSDNKTDAWERWIQEAEQLTLKPNPINTDYSRYIHVLIG